MTDTIKKHSTIGCCGIDCGLCPRFHTQGISACPGCGGIDFKEKHPSCGFLSCCAINRGHEACSECEEYPCKRFDPEKIVYDSFVTHKRIFANLDLIKSKGIDEFILMQELRMNILSDFISRFDDGRSKSYFCLSCALLPLGELQELHRFIHNRQITGLTLKEQNRILRDNLQNLADRNCIELKLNKKK